MNSFLFRSIAICFFLVPHCLWAQTGTASSHPLHPLQLLAESNNHQGYIKLAYSSPYGIKSIQDFSIDMSFTVSHGLLLTETQRIGIKGYAQYHFGLGYALSIGDDIETALILNANLLPVYLSNKCRISPGSSFYSKFRVSENFGLNIFINNWTSLWLNGRFESQKANLSVIARLKTHERIDIISGLSYTNGFIPLIRVGVKIIADDSHTIVAGLQTGPSGFWFGYIFSMSRLDFILTIQSGGVFGYEPGSSMKYMLN
jgi:hypothetical protein